MAATRTQSEEWKLGSLPCSERYERSYLHRDTVTIAKTTKKSGLLITGSADGFCKFWSRSKASLNGGQMDGSLDCLRVFRPHLGNIRGIELSPDDELLVTFCGTDQWVKVFDLKQLEMVTMFSVGFMPSAICWVHSKSFETPMLAVAAKGHIHFFEGVPSAVTSHSIGGLGGGERKPVFSIRSMHMSSEISMIRFHAECKFCISIDEKSMIEYWSIDAENIPSSAGKFPKSSLKFSMKLETDLFIFAKKKLQIWSFEFSASGSNFVILASDWSVRVFDTLSAKVIFCIELTHFYSQIRNILTEEDDDDDTSLGEDGSGVLERKEIPFGGIDEKTFYLVRHFQDSSNNLPLPNVIFDGSGEFILFPNLLNGGFQVFDWLQGKPLLTVGQREEGPPLHPINLCLLSAEDLSKSGGRLTVEMVISDNVAFKNLSLTDPLAIALLPSSNRFYIYSRREPKLKESGGGGGSFLIRDMMNEQLSSSSSSAHLSAEASSKKTKYKFSDYGPEDTILAILRTEYGDIIVDLYPGLAPKAVENFTTHAAQKYYDGTIFHRIIKGFMIQGGDPLGDGTGGESIWGKDFEDEILPANHPTLNFTKSYILCMANTGKPFSNGSQFFITVAPAKWLQGKHTIFGKVTAGLDVVKKIELEPTNPKYDKPFNDIRIIDIEINFNSH